MPRTLFFSIDDAAVPLFFLFISTRVSTRGWLPLLPLPGGLSERVEDATVPGQTNKGFLICARKVPFDHGPRGLSLSSATRSCPPSDRPCFVVVVRDRDACLGCKRLRFCMHTRTAAAAAHPYDGMRCTYLFSFSSKSASVRRFLYGRVLPRWFLPALGELHRVASLFRFSSSSFYYYYYSVAYFVQLACIRAAAVADGLLHPSAFRAVVVVVCFVKKKGAIFVSAHLQRKFVALFVVSRCFFFSSSSIWLLPVYEGRLYRGRRVKRCNSEERLSVSFDSGEDQTIVAPFSRSCTDSRGKARRCIGVLYASRCSSSAQSARDFLGKKKAIYCGCSVVPGKCHRRRASSSSATASVVIGEASLAAERPIR